jgi:hypothetical protein
MGKHQCECSPSLPNNVRCAARNNLRSREERVERTMQAGESADGFAMVEVGSSSSFEERFKGKVIGRTLSISLSGK